MTTMFGIPAGVASIGMRECREADAVGSSSILRIMRLPRHEVRPGGPPDTENSGAGPPPGRLQAAGKLFIICLHRPDSLDFFAAMCPEACGASALVLLCAPRFADLGGSGAVDARRVQISPMRR
ncbi:MAG: hypothetical protein KGJ64_09890, partial [Betaproteobacteria bacterium]|nr:hypothetical protein [Betaproteobacteria bacterium]